MNTTATADMIALIQAEVSQLQKVMAGFDSAAWSQPSACAGWTVGDVMAHLIQGARNWCDGITRAVAGDANPPPGQQALRPGERGSEVTAQRAVAFRQEIGNTALRTAFTEAYQQLHQVLLGLHATDWDKPCFHRRGVLPVRDYVGLRLQELTIHGWDMRSAFDAAATVSEGPLPVLVGIAQRWLANTFRPVPGLTAPVRYRFDIAGPVPIHQDVLVSQDGFQTTPPASSAADVTFRCTTGNYLLFVYGRLSLEGHVDSGRLQVEGNRQQAALFSALFRGV
jgi:uncharacterized protein (TIGR03083 family)